MEPSKTKEPVFWIFLFSAPCSGLFLRQISVFQVRFLHVAGEAKTAKDCAIQATRNIVQFKRLDDVVVWFRTLAVRGVVHLPAAATKCAVCQTRNVLLGDLFAVGWAAPQAFRVYMICRLGCWYIAYTHVNATLGKYITTIIMFLTVFVQFGGSDNCSRVCVMRFPGSKRIAWRHDGLGHGDASRKIERYCKNL